MSNDPGWIKLIPIDINSVQINILLIFIVLSSIIFTPLMGYVFSPLLLWVHKKIIGRNNDYGFQQIERSEKFKGFLKSFFPSVMAINFALMLADSPSFWELIVVDPTDPIAPFLSLLFLLPFTTCICSCIFSPVWFLLDSGIVYTNINTGDMTKPRELRNVGRWYLYILKGYSGIAVFFSFYTFLTRSIETSQGKLHFSTPLSFFVLPFLLTFLAIPGIILLDVNSDKRTRFVLKWAQKFEILQSFDLQLKKQ